MASPYTLQRMRPTPVVPGARVSLKGSDANPPSGLPADLAGATDALLSRLAHLQAAMYAEAKRALLVILQGRDASGKDATIKAVCGAFNPQGCDVTSFRAPSEDELAHDYLWRVHAEVPAVRMVGIFNRSHYEDVLVARVDHLVRRPVWQARYRQINEFERILTESGTEIVKICLHVSKREQRRRLAERLKDPEKNWKIAASDLDDRARWHDYTLAYRDMLAKCSTRSAPWYVVPADDRHARNYLAASIIAGALERIAPHYPRADRKLLARFKKLA
jgi:PPK2 family polyphosphate:nucleotide phosphotransferase